MTYNRVIIIGNGFDLDLGLKTSYKNFYESDFWPLKGVTNIESPLAYYVHKQTTINSWFDLENILYSYAKNGQTPFLSTSKKLTVSIDNAIKEDKLFYSKLKDSLENFIRSQSNSSINKSSVASIVLSNLIRYSNSDKIFTFNYTDLSSYAQQICGNSIEYQHVHGSCVDSSSIIGVSDSYKLRMGYDFLYKTSSKHYQSSNVRYALQNSKDVVFFGHSLGEQDYHYFQDFFRRQCRDDMTENDKCKITFFTKDDDSRLKLISQLRSMNDGRVNYLYDCNDLQFIHTDNVDSKLDLFIKYLENTNYREIAKQISDLMK